MLVAYILPNGIGQNCYILFGTDMAVRNACYSWVEHCDWIPFVLTGQTDIHQIKRGVCSAGHKALWSHPLADFLLINSSVHPGSPARRICIEAGCQSCYTADQSAGTLSTYWSEKLGLPKNVVVAAGAFDAHMGAVGGQIEPYFLSKVMGTSTCDMLVAPLDGDERKTRERYMRTGGRVRDSRNDGHGSWPVGIWRCLCLV